MKFKMAPNSLFAVLLRKPWWISLLIAGGLGLVAAAFSPPETRAYAGITGLPFFVLALIAFKRQWGVPSERQVEFVTNVVAGLAWEAFRALLEQAFTRDGYQVERVQGAADLRLTKDARCVLVSARRWKAARQGEDTVQALQALRHAQETQGAQQATGAMLIALGDLTPNAIRLARSHDIALVQGEGLAQLLRGLPLPRPVS